MSENTEKVNIVIKRFTRIVQTGAKQLQNRNKAKGKE